MIRAGLAAGMSLLACGCGRAGPETEAQCVARFTSTAERLPVKFGVATAVYSYDVTAMSVDARNALMMKRSPEGQPPSMTMTMATASSPALVDAFLKQPVTDQPLLLLGDRSFYRVRATGRRSSGETIALGCRLVRDGARLIRIDTTYALPT